MCPVRPVAYRNAVTITFPPGPVWARVARAAVRTVVAAGTVRDARVLVGTAVPLTSEAVTNAVAAAGCGMVREPVAVRAAWADTGEPLAGAVDEA